MRRCFVFLIMTLTAIPVAAAADCHDVEALNALYGIRELVIGGASSYTVDSEIDDHIDALRVPLAEGGFKWVRLVRPPGDGGPYDREKHFVRSASEQSPDTFESEAPDAYAVSIVVPRKRSLFRKNNESWIGDVRITCTVDGHSETHRESIQRWMQPDTSHTIDVGGIAERCRVRVDAITKGDYLDEEALVEIHIRQAVEEDDPENPNYDTIRVLQKIRHSTSPETLDYEIAKLERRLFPDLYSFPFTTLLNETREAQRLLTSDKEEDQRKGARMLAEVVKEIEKN